MERAQIDKTELDQNGHDQFAKNKVETKSRLDLNVLLKRLKVEKAFSFRKNVLIFLGALLIFFAVTIILIF